MQARRAGSRSERGYTLIEILVVVVIAGVLASVALLRLGNTGPEQQLAREADRLQARLEALCEQALLTARPHGVRMTADGYDFWRHVGGQWQPLGEHERPLAASWPEGMRARLSVRGQPVAATTALRPQLVCSALEPFEPFEWQLELGAERRVFRYPEPLP